jgi:hypothetical protein
MDDGERILVAGAEEGDGLVLYGRRTPLGWLFHPSWAGRRPAAGDAAGALPAPDEFRDWESALAALDGCAWYRLPAVLVHPEFRDRVWAAVTSRLAPEPATADAYSERLLQRWRERCRGAGA